MKSLSRVFSAIVVLFLLNSCELFDDLLDVEFETGVKELSFTVNPASSGEHTLVDKVMLSDIQAEIDDHGGDLVNLKEITVDKVDLEILTLGQDFDPFGNVKVYISSEGISEILVGSIENIGTELLSLQLDINNEGLVEILKNEEYKIRVVGYLNEEIVKPIEMLLKISYKVVVGA